MAAIFCALLLLIQLIAFGQSSPPVDRSLDPPIEVHSKDLDYRLTYQFGCSILKYAPSKQADYERCVQEWHSLRQVVESTCQGSWLNLTEFDETAAQNVSFFDGPPSLLRFYKEHSKSGKPIGGILLYWVRSTLSDQDETSKHEQSVGLYKQMADLIAKRAIVPSGLLQHFGITKDLAYVLRGKACNYNNQTNSLDFRLSEKPSIYDFYLIFVKHYWQLATDYFWQALDYLKANWTTLLKSWSNLNENWTKLKPQLNELLERYWIVIPLALGVLLAILISCVIFRKRTNSYFPQSLELALRNRAKLIPANQARTKVSNMASKKF